jgi:hypothetical protein
MAYIEGVPVAKNKPTCDNRRIGAVRRRSQTKMPDGHRVKRDDKTGRFMDIKSYKKPFKGVRKREVEMRAPGAVRTLSFRCAQPDHTQYAHTLGDGDSL